MKNLFKQRGFLLILFGFLLSSTFYLYLQNQYEKKVLNAYINSIHTLKSNENKTDENLVLAAMEKTHLIMRQKEVTAMGLELNEGERMFTSPLLAFALTKDGACGGNSLVLAEILDGMGYDIRPVQMKVNGKYGGHIILEAAINDKWVALDPSYNLSFRTPEGELASFKEISANWNFYKTQVPEGYNQAFAYEDARYTNWSKLSFIGTGLKSLIAFFKGKEYAKHFSLKKYMLQPKKILFNISLAAFLLILFITTKRVFIHLHYPKLSFINTFFKKRTVRTVG